MQGFQYQVDKEPIINIPLIKTDRRYYAICSHLVDYIIFLKANTKIKTNEYVS
jgi:hypothetical protein